MNDISSAARRLALAGLGAIAAAGAAQDAAAAFRVCNETGHVTSFAMAYATGGTFLSKGWWTVQPGHCAYTVSGDLQGRYFYVYGYDSFGAEYGGPYLFCTADHTYSITPGDDLTGCVGDRSAKGFAEVDTGEYRDFIYTVQP